MMDSPIGIFRARMLLRSGYRPPIGTVMEQMMVEIDARERRVQLYQTAALIAAALHKAEQAEKAYCAFVDELMPENVKERKGFAQRAEKVLAKEILKVHPVIPLIRKPSVLERLPRIEVRPLGKGNKEDK